MTSAGLGDALDRWSTLRPNAVFVKEAETGWEISYGECRRAVARLRRQLGERPRRIALALPGSIPTAVVWLAALTGGHQLAPLPAEATDDEKRRFAALMRPDLLVVDQLDAACGFGLGDATILTRPQLEALIRQAAAEPAEAAPALDRAGSLCLTTSGTTGTPKRIELRADHLAWTADQIRRCHRLTPDDRGLCVLPFSHINAPVVSLCATLMAGGTVVVTPRFSRSRFWHWIERERITWASIVPAIVAVLLQTERPRPADDQLRFVRTASAPLPPLQLQTFERRFGVPVIETYGLSEAGSTVAANPVPPEAHRPGSVGRPVGVWLRVCALASGDPSEPLRDLPPGQPGELCISGPGVISGYGGGVSPGSFQGGWFRTGDLGYLDADGFVYITGRLKELINRGGEKISPREIEEVLLAHPAVREVAVVGQSDPIYGEQPVAVVVRNGWGSDDLSAELTAHCRAYLSSYKVPVAFIEMDELARTATGKVQRHLVRDALASFQQEALRYGVA